MPIKVNYTSYQFTKPIVYTLFQYQQNESIFVYVGDTLLGSLTKSGDYWLQVSGREMMQETVDELGKFLDLIDNGS